MIAELLIEKLLLSQTGRSWWVSPKGKVYKIREGHHWDFIAKNKELFVTITGEDWKLGATSTKKLLEIDKEIIQTGWVRIQNFGNEYGVDAYSIRRAQDAISSVGIKDGYIQYAIYNVPYKEFMTAKTNRDLR